MKLLPETLLAMLLLAACAGRPTRPADRSTPPPPATVLNQIAAAHTVDPTPDGADSDRMTPEAADLLGRIEPFLEAEKRMRTALVDRLERSSPAEADSLFVAGDYLFLTTSAGDSLLHAIAPLVERCCGGGKLLPSDSTVIGRLLASGIAIESIGEGEVEPRTERYYYYRIFRPYLTPETERYARLTADNDTQFCEDAGLTPSLETLYLRSLRWEEFLDDYPRTRYRPLIAESYKLYMQNLLFCWYDNTTTFEWEWGNDSRVYGMIEDYWLEELRPLLQTGPGSRTRAILEQYLTALEAQDYLYTESFEADITALFDWIDTPQVD